MLSDLSSRPQHAAVGGPDCRCTCERLSRPIRWLAAGFCWAENRKVTQVVFKPKWTKHAKAAPLRRNDEMLSVMPAGVIVFPGFGITVWDLK
jgi:hypothetical protein